MCISVFGLSRLVNLKLAMLADRQLELTLVGSLERLVSWLFYTTEGGDKHYL